MGLENSDEGRSKEKKRAERLANAELTFSFAQLRADSLKKSANRCRREHKCSKIGNFTNLRKHPLALELTLYPSTLTIKTTSEELSNHIDMLKSAVATSQK